MTSLFGLALLSLCLAPNPQPAASELDVAVGVRYDLDADPVKRRTDLENMRRLRFTVIALPKHDPAARFEVVLIAALLAGGPTGSLRVAASAFGIVPVTARTEPGRVREGAWTELASGTRGVIFDDWAGLQQNAHAFAEASAFAETIARNMALYAPLRRVESTGSRAITITGSRDNVEAHWLESEDAMLLIAINRAAEPRSVTLTFPAEIPEAVWQNMLSGASVNFVAGPTGPFYEYTFPARDVLVLMIRKRWK